MKNSWYLVLSVRRHLWALTLMALGAYLCYSGNLVAQTSGATPTTNAAALLRPQHEPVKNIDVVYGSMWHMKVPIWEFVIRGIIIYVFLIILLRVTGKRQIGQMSPFDLVLLLILSNAVQNAMNGGDESVLGGAISALTLVIVNSLVATLTYRSKRAEALIEGRPALLIYNGRLCESARAKAKLTLRELRAALRENGCRDVKDVRAAFLENDGKISVIPKTK